MKMILSLYAVKDMIAYSIVVLPEKRHRSKISHPVKRMVDFWNCTDAEMAWKANCWTRNLKSRIKLRDCWYS